MRYQVTNPLAVEFSTGRISPYLTRTATEIAAAWDQSHRADEHSAPDEIEINSMRLDEDGEPDPASSPISIGTPQVSHLMLPADPNQEPHWVTRPWHEVHGFPPELIAGTNPERLVGAELRANAGLVLQRLEYRAGPLWPVVLSAVVFGKTMADIGREYGGGNSSDAAKVGRPLVVAGLRLCARALDEIECGQTPDEARRQVPRRAAVKSIAVERYFAHQRAIRLNGFLLAPDCHP